MKFLIAGRNGQLARAFLERLGGESPQCSAPEEKGLDITDERSVMEAVAACRPDVILNCAAYNLVDQAEREQELVSAVNARGPKNLAAAASRHGALLVHFSSDYVFDGAKESGLYNESDPVNPLNRYGATKREGEILVGQETDRALILRLSWVYGDGAQNFIHKLREWAARQEYLKIACDEFSVPTSTRRIVDVTMKALEQGVTGLYHLTGSGYCSRYEWAKTALAALGINKFIRPVSMDAFNLPAQRPRFSAMSNQRLAALLGIEIPAWEDDVRLFCAHLSSPGTSR